MNPLISRWLAAAAVLWFLFIVNSSAANQDAEGPYLSPPDNWETQQHWKLTDPLPVSLADIGFETDFKEVYVAIWTDGGSQGYLFRDSKGAYFAFCYYQPMGPTSQKSPRRCFAGVLYPKGIDDREVPIGSDTEKFMRSLFKADSERG